MHIGSSLMEKGPTIFSKILTREATEVVGRVWDLGSNLYYSAFCDFVKIP